MLVKTILNSCGSRISRWGEGADLLGGHNLQHGCFLTETHAKMKELGPIGGAHWRPPGSATVEYYNLHDVNYCFHTALLLFIHTNLAMSTLVLVFSYF